MSQTIQLGKRYATLHQFTGKVMSTSKNMETKVHGGGGGGYSYQGTGGSAPVRISSTTVVHDQLFIQTKDGEERALQLQDFDLAVREGNIVTAMWGIPEGKNEGPYYAVINHSTRSQFVSDKKVRDIVQVCTRPINIDNNALGCLLLIGIAVTLAVIWWPLLIAFFGYAIWFEFAVVRKYIKVLKATIQAPQVEAW
ncbi:MAG: hypothetical protein IT225_07965 [Flavobacteriales bacterium]|jgi:hypothetical protein|nr:hypothetical protein [Flavobacteriales bacterium]